MTLTFPAFKILEVFFLNEKGICIGIKEISYENKVIYRYENKEETPSFLKKIHRLQSDILVIS